MHLDIAKIQSSEEVEITPKEAKDMLKELKLSYPYTHYDSKIPDNHALRVVKTPDPEEILRGDEWALMYEKWRKDLNDHVHTKEVKEFVKPQKKVCKDVIRELPHTTSDVFPAFLTPPPLSDFVGFDRPPP